MAPDTVPPTDGEAAGRVLEAFLRERGVTTEQIEAAAQHGNLGALVVDIATGPTGTTRFAEAAMAVGAAPDAVRAAWRALGFPDPTLVEPLLRPEEISALQLVASVGADLLGPQAVLALARVVGDAAARVANAVVDAFRAEVEVPRLSSGVPYDEVMRTYAGLVESSLPQLQSALAACLRRHLVTAAAGSWSLSEAEAVPERELAVGFVDLVGWTSTTRAVGARDLAALVRRFETVVGETAEAHGVRVVKLLGDGAMFIHADAATACVFATEAVAALARDPELPRARGGVAAGPVMTFNGDFYGGVVNLAARLAAVAPAGAVLADEQVRRRAPGQPFGPAQSLELRGIAGPVSGAVVIGA